MKCTKAVIAVGGFGTRWLPLTKSIEKCMVPVGNRPVIDYLVDDCIKAGISDIYFVVSEQNEQIRHYYSDNDSLFDHLTAKGKLDTVKELQAISRKARFHFVVQDPKFPYGTAIPAMLCEKYLPSDEKMIILMGDNFIHTKDGTSVVAQLMKHVEDSGAEAGMVAVHVPKQKVNQYGIIDISHQQGKQVFKRIVEKPAIEDAPSTLSNVSMYLFDHELLGCLQHIHPTNGEYYITEALNIYVEQLKKPIAVSVTKGEYLDCGTVEGWLHANQYMASQKDI